MRPRRIAIFILILLMTACSGKPNGETPTAAVTATSAAEATPTETPTAAPSPTPEPAALRVNGEEVPLSEFQAQAVQIEAAQPGLDPDQRRQLALDDLVNQTLLAQAAAADGFLLDEAALQARMDALAQEMGGETALSEWQGKMGYSAESFRSALQRSIAAAWMRDQILGSVPAEAEQVHARQILLRTEEGARQVEQQAKFAGTNFATLAAGYDLATRGDLYWFPRGYLNEPAVEEAAFALEPGEISGVIQSGIGYHILQVVAKEVRPLSADARLVLQRKVLAAWLAEQRQKAQVDILAP